MEFIEYYQIIRSRVWLAIMMAAAALVVVTVYQVMPAARRTAEGQMQASTGAMWTLRWAGNQVSMTQNREFWGTFEQFVTSRYIRDLTAQKSGVTNPDELLKLRTLQFERSKRGNYFTVRGSRPTANEAKDYVSLAMTTIAEEWDRQRKKVAEAAIAELQKRQAEKNKELRALQAQMDRAQVGEHLGKPPDLLAWIQGQINSLQGNITSAKVDIGIAQDRLTALHALARREESLPVEQRLLTTSLTGPAASFQAQLVTLETQKSQMLLSRTPRHPDVIALDRQMEQLRSRIKEAESKQQQGGTNGQPQLPSALREQITMAELDLRAAQRRVDALMAEESRLRSQVPALLEATHQYQKLEDQFNAAASEAATIKSSLQLAQAELTRLGKGLDLVPVGEAIALPSGKTFGKFLMMAVAGGFGGFVIGCMLIFVLHYVDLTFKNEAEAEQLLNYPVMAGIPRSDIVLVPAAPAGEAGPPDEGGASGETNE